MIINNLEYHNTGSEVEMLNGKALIRLPEKIKNKLNDRARFVALDSTGCEIRFVTEAPTIDICYSWTQAEFTNQTELQIFKGDFKYHTLNVTPGVIHYFRLESPPAFKDVNPKALNNKGFDSNVWRLCPNKGGTMLIHNIDTFGYEIRPPAKDEKPPVKWLAYGSSITNSSREGYANVAARILRFDVMNKGMSGACHCEKELIDWFADECDWDIITCELGINMLDCFSELDFKKRVDYALDKLSASKPDKTVIALSLFPSLYSANWAIDEKNATKNTNFHNIVENTVFELNRSNLHFISGSDILERIDYLSADILHPCNLGHAIMGEKLAQKIKLLLN